MNRVFYRWENRAFPVPRRALFVRLARRAIELAGLKSGDWDLSVRFLDDAAMASANQDYVGHQGTTDVITFSYLDDPESCFPGEVAVELLICVDVAWREGEETKIAGRSYAGELALYLVHGLLHASGEDDLTPEDARSMRRREKEVMTVLEKEFELKDIFPAPERFRAGE